ncbi:hypothetical protein ABPG72_008650 [Tetrahymena utriculariae]
MILQNLNRLARCSLAPRRSRNIFQIVNLNSTQQLSYMGKFFQSTKAPESAQQDAKQEDRSTISVKPAQSQPSESSPRPEQQKFVTDEELAYFKGLRIYKEKTTLELVNLFMINKLLHYSVFVNNADRVYKICSKVLGHRITEIIIKNTMGRAFTGGSNIPEIMSFAKKLESRNIPVIVDYCCEALEEDQNEFFMDRSAKVFEQTVNVGDNVNRHKVSMKISGLINMEVLKKINSFGEQIDSLYQQIDRTKKGFITGQELHQALVEKGIKIEESDTQEFIKTVLEIKDSKSLQDTQIRQLIWRIRVHPYYIQSEKNQLKISKYLTKLDQHEISKAENFLRRMEFVFDAAFRNKTRVLVDAEQSFIQRAIDSFLEQYQIKYNVEAPIVYTTFQNYLKSSSQRVAYEIAKCKELKMPFGVKMVRGAYINEETRIAKEKGIENPICDGLDKTTEMIESNLKFLVDNLLPGSELLIGSHNKETIVKMKQYMKSKGIPNNSQQVYFSQLLGLADHLTYSLVDEGYSVYKYIPFGETHIMIPYLIRRAQESFQVLSSVEFQYSLLKDETKRRTPFYY